MIHKRTLEALEFDKIKNYLANFCATNPGREMALAAAPMPAPHDVEQAFTLYREAGNLFAQPGDKDIFAFSSVPDVAFFAGFFDASSNAEKLIAKLEIEHFWILRELLRTVQNIRRAVEKPAGATEWPLLLQMVQDAPFPAQLAAALERCISDDCLLKDESSPELYRLRSDLRSLHRNCLAKVGDYVRQYNMQHYLQDEFMTLSSDRYVLPLKGNFKGRMQGIIHDWSQTGETCYFEPIFLVEINNRLQELKHEERREERNILQYLANLLLDAHKQVQGAATLLGTLDFLKAKTSLAAALDCHPVTLCSPAEGISLLQARHPLLELARKPASGQALKKGIPAGPVQPIDIVVRPDDRGLVITGGNAGGKTVCLKTFGLVAAMTLSGLPAPAAAGSHMPWLERLDAFIGDEQSLDDNVSTFTAQIDHLAKAWKHLDGNSLVLLDEFGAGTDPAEGSALAQAVLDNLLEKNCFVLCATHFPALKSYALTRERMRAATMLFDSKTSRPLFKIAYDQVGASQALTIAREHGLPPEIVNRAERYLLQEGTDSTTLLSRLNDLAAKREEELDLLRLEQSKCRTRLKNEQDKLDRERKKLREEIGAQSRELMHAWRQNRMSAKQALKELNALKTDLGVDLPPDNSVLPVPESFAKGQEVFHAVFQKKGVITDMDERRKRVRLDMNGVGIWASQADLRATTAAQATKKPVSAILAPAKNDATLSLNFDVRGLRANEAVSQIEKYLDRAVLEGFSHLEIVHGRGTGALRREVHQYLRSSPLVQDIELAPEDRGGDGMTIVTLK